MNPLSKIKCVHCSKELGYCSIKTFGKYFRGYKSNSGQGFPKGHVEGSSETEEKTALCKIYVAAG